MCILNPEVLFLERLRDKGGALCVLAMMLAAAALAGWLLWLLSTGGGNDAAEGAVWVYSGTLEEAERWIRDV